MRAPLLMLAVAALPAAELHFVPDGRPLTLLVEKAGLLSGKRHIFEFHNYSGSLNFDPVDPAAAVVQLDVMAADFRVIDTWIGENDRKKVADYARSAEMLDSTRHPKIHFAGKGAVKAGEDSYWMSGQLTIRTVTKPVRIEVKTRQHGGDLIVAGRTIFPMTLFGLKPPSAALGTIRTKDEMTLQFEVLARQP